MAPRFVSQCRQFLPSFREAPGAHRNAWATQPPKPPTVGESQSLQDQQFEERLRIAERLVQALREGGLMKPLRYPRRVVAP